MRARRVAAWSAAALGLTLALLLAALVATAWWSVRSERGSAWLLSVLPGVQVDAPRGRLLGDFDAKRVVMHWPGGSATLAGVAWRGLAVERAAAPLWLHVGIDSLAIERVDVAFAPATNSEPLTAPTGLRLPIELELRALRIGELHTPALGAQPLRELHAHVHLGANHGAEHRVDQLTLAWDRLQGRGDARIASTAPLALQASLDLAQHAAATLPPWSASATLAGPLAAPLLQATLRAAAGPDRPAQTVDVRAALRPFAAWPLGELQASTQALDLSAFSSAAPTTALTGRAVAISSAVDVPAKLTLDLSNALAGRWNEGKLPLRRIALELAGRPDQAQVLSLERLDAELGTPQASAGRITGRGRWSPGAWSLDAQLADLRPALLDARAPAMRFSGPLALAGAAAVTIKTQLAGRVDGIKAARAVRLDLDATLNAQRIELRGFQALAGEARAQVAGLITHTASDAPWAAKLDATLKDFDPALWWPGRDDSSWRSKANRLNATGKIDLALPAAATARAPLAMLAALHGQAAITLEPSTLVGVPLTGSATLHSDAGAQLAAAIDLVADGNRVRASGRLATSGDGAGDAWEVSVDAPALTRLAPVYRLLQPASADATLAGALTAKAQLSGRWPALTTQGQLEANALRVGAVSVGNAQGRWLLGSSATAPVDAQLTLTAAGLARGAVAGPSLDTLQLLLKGTGRAHTLEVRADSKARPPAWVDSVQAAAGSATAAAHTLALLQAQGGLVDLPGAALAGWRGTIALIDVRSTATAANAAPLLSTRDVVIEALWADGPPRVSVQPGRAEVLGGALRWSRIAWAAAARADGFAQIEAEAEVEPLRIAPLLARAQPDFGWGGDLAVTAHLKLRTSATPTPGFSADIVVERSSGDLTVTDEEGTRALGLTDLRFGLAADNGVWNFSQGMAGKTLGVAAGAVVVRTAPEATWPTADAPIQGVLELDVAELGTWGTWVPPGWRLAGALHASAAINGRFGAPEYTGEVRGTQLGVRNFLQGVNVSEGDVAVRLQGTSARIERFSAKAGGGSVKVEGTASLGETPKAVLQLSADKFQLLGRVDRRIVASGQGQLQLDAKSLAFNGQFGVDEGLIDFTRGDAPGLSSDVEVVRAKGAPAPVDAASAPVANPVREVALDLRVALGDKLRLRGRGIDTGLSGDLRITSPGGRLAVNGTVRATDGTYAAYGQKLTIDRGLISFNGAIENPRLDIEATRPNIDVRVGVAVSGYATDPRVRLFSEPELAEIDKLSWLVMGRASEGLGRTDTALLQRAALALLAGEGGGITDQLTKAIGLDDIGVRQQTDGEVRETVISLGKQLSRRWYVGYERGLNATTGNFQLIYRIAQRFTLRAQSGQDSSLDLIWTWRWK